MEDVIKMRKSRIRKSLDVLDKKRSILIGRRTRLNKRFGSLLYKLDMADSSSKINAVVRELKELRKKELSLDRALRLNRIRKSEVIRRDY